MTEPTPPARTTRAKATWTVFQLINDAAVYSSEDGPDGAILHADHATVLVEIDGNVVTRTGAEACWKIAETTLLERATSDDPPVLVASRNGTAHGLTEARPYPLKPTVERVR